MSFSAAKEGKPVYRLYDPHDGNHLYTVSKNEKRHLISIGWNDEGIGWHTSDDGAVNVYRLYNPRSGEHIFTADRHEYDKVGSIGWHKEGVAWKGN